MSTYEDQVNSLVAQADDNGVLPESVEADEGLRYAANAELRRRATQSSYTKSQQELKALQATNTALATNWEKDAINNLSLADKAELDELKSQDPDAWRAKIGELELANKAKFDEKVDGIAKEASQLTELEQRELELEEFNKANPDFVITDDVIANDVPPRITNQLKNGDITWTEFLNKAKNYVETPKSVPKTKVTQEPNLGDLRGGQEPTSEAKNKQSSADYSKEIY